MLGNWACSPSCKRSQTFRNSRLAGRHSMSTHNVKNDEVIEMNNRRWIITFLLMTLGNVVSAQAQTCTPTAVPPYTHSSGAWNMTAAATVNAGSQIVFGPQPIQGGAWSWSGSCGTSGFAREQFVTPSASCITCGATAQGPFIWYPIQWLCQLLLKGHPVFVDPQQPVYYGQKTNLDPRRLPT